jgi:hypothetical protein
MSRLALNSRFSCLNFQSATKPGVLGNLSNEDTWEWGQCLLSLFLHVIVPSNWVDKTSLWVDVSQCLSVLCYLSVSNKTKLHERCNEEVLIMLHKGQADASSSYNDFDVGSWRSTCPSAFIFPQKISIKLLSSTSTFPQL